MIQNRKSYHPFVIATAVFAIPLIGIVTAERPGKAALLSILLVLFYSLLTRFTYGDSYAISLDDSKIRYYNYLKKVSIIKLGFKDYSLDYKIISKIDYKKSLSLFGIDRFYVYSGNKTYKLAFYNYEGENLYKKIEELLKTKGIKFEPAQTTKTTTTP